MAPLLVCVFLCTTGPVKGQPAKPKPIAAKPVQKATKILVGVKQSPPFTFKSKDGSWQGITIQLWRGIARSIGVDFELREYDLKGLLRVVEQSKIDVAVAPLTVTPEREARFNFSHPFHTTGLGIAVPKADRGAWLSVVESFFSLRFLKVIAGLSALLLVVGLVVWLFERRRNPEEFGGRRGHGLAAGFWWSAVTMTTVGYGDKSPRTLGGRLVALVWMFGSIIIISSFTAAITSALTVRTLESAIQGPQDLPGVRVASIPHSTSAHYLDRSKIAFQGFATVEQALQAVAEKHADAAVYDAPILRYLVRSRFRKQLRVLPRTFERQDYALALPSDSPLREKVNRALLKAIATGEWQKLVESYLGE